MQDASAEYLDLEDFVADEDEGEPAPTPGPSEQAQRQMLEDTYTSPNIAPFLKWFQPSGKPQSALRFERKLHKEGFAVGTVPPQERERLLKEVGLCMCACTTHCCCVSGTGVCCQALGVSALAVDVAGAACWLAMAMAGACLP